MSGFTVSAGASISRSAHSTPAVDEGSAAAPRIALLGPYGSGNLGDVAIQTAAIANLKRLRPEATIFGVAGDAADAAAHHGIACHPIAREIGAQRLERLRIVGRLWGLIAGAWFSFGVWRLMRSMDLLVISGGGQIDDFWGGPWRHPFALLRWAALARLAGTPVAVASVGLDSLTHKLSRRFLRAALGIANYRSFRDRKTLDFVSGALDLRRGGKWVPDLAFSLPVERCRPEPGADGASRPIVVGVSPISHAAWTHADDPVYAIYMTAMRALLADLRERGIRVRLFPSQVKMDVAALETLYPPGGALSAPADSLVTINPVETLSQMLNEIDACDIVVAARLHGVLISLLKRKPVVAISYTPKVRILMEEMGCADLSIDVERLSAGTLVEKLDEAIARRREITALEDRTVADWAAMLDRQYDEILALIE